MTHQTAQRFGDLKPMKVALSENIRKTSVIDLNRALADSIVLRDLYKKHHWQVSGPTFRELHLLFDENQAQQGELIDQIAERIMQLGGVSIAMGVDAAEESEIPRPPRDREAPVAHNQESGIPPKRTGKAPGQTTSTPARIAPCFDSEI